MPKQPANLAPSTLRLLEAMGERIRLARLRRNLSQTLVAQRAGLSLATYRAVEAGSPSGSMGSYLAVLEVMGLARDLDAVATTDDLGRTLQDSQLPAHASGRRRARLKKSPGILTAQNQSERIGPQELASLDTSHEPSAGNLSVVSSAAASVMSLEDLVSYLQPTKHPEEGN